MNNPPDRIFLTDVFDDDGLFWVNERESEADVEYIRKDIADEAITDEGIESNESGFGTGYGQGYDKGYVAGNRFGAETKAKQLKEILKPISAEWKRIENNNTLWHMVPSSVKNAIRETLELARKAGVE